MILIRIKDLRAKHNLNQIKTAEIMGVSKSTYARWETDEAIIPLVHLNDVCNYFNVSMDSLIQEKAQVVYSPIKVFMREVKSAGGKAAIETAEKLMDLYSFHHKFQTKEYINKCNQVWSDE